MQFGLPNMRAIFIHKSYNNFVTPTICFTQSRRKLEPTRSTLRVDAPVPGLVEAVLVREGLAARLS